MASKSANKSKKKNPQKAAAQQQAAPSLVILLVIPVVGIALALGLLLANGEGSSTDSSSVQQANLGRGPAPNFQLTGLDGSPLNLEDYQGRVVFLNFWASYCPPCIRELPDFQTFAKQQGENGAAVIAANNYDDLDGVYDFLREHNMDLSAVDIGLDPGGRAGNQYSITSLPTTYIIDAEGQVSDVHYGLITLEQMYAYLNDVS